MAGPITGSGLRKHLGETDIRYLDYQQMSGAVEGTLTRKEDGSYVVVSEDKEYQVVNGARIEIKNRRGNPLIRQVRALPEPTE
jgi:hypothetical protein